MDKNRWLNVIKGDLNLLSQLADEMIHDGGLTRAEVEVAVSRAKDVVREFEILLETLKIASPEIIPESVEQLAVPPESSSLVVNISEEISEEMPEDVSVESIPAPIEVIQEEPVPSMEPLASEVITEISVDLKPEETEPLPLVNVSESFPELKPEDRSQVRALPLRSIREGLSLNDRYLFQKELFENNKSKLDETVAALDRLSSLKEAVEYLKEHFVWNKSEATDKFLHLVKRRFANL